MRTLGGTESTVSGLRLTDLYDSRLPWQARPMLGLISGDALFGSLPRFQHKPYRRANKVVTAAVFESINPLHQSTPSHAFNSFDQLLVSVAGKSESAVRLAIAASSSVSDQPSHAMAFGDKLKPCPRSRADTRRSKDFITWPPKP